MKKKTVGFVVGMMGFMLVACGSQESEVAVTETPTFEVEDYETEATQDETEDSGAADDEVYVGFGMENPWVDSDKAGVFEATGFDITPLADSVNVAYSYMPSTGMAQMNFNLDYAMWVYRMQPADELTDISGMYYEWNYIGETTVAGMEAMEYSYASEPDENADGAMDCVRVINWYDAQNKVTYSLSALSPDLNGMDIAAYAESLFNW